MPHLPSPLEYYTITFFPFFLYIFLNLVSLSGMRFCWLVSLDTDSYAFENNLCTRGKEKADRNYYLSSNVETANHRRGICPLWP